MAGITIELEGLDALLNSIKQIEAQTRLKVAQAVTDVTQDAQYKSLPLIPEETGYLYSRQQIRIGGGSGRIWGELFNDAPYALFVCMGHHTRSGSWVAPQDFMTPAYLYGSKHLMTRLRAIFP